MNPECEWTEVWSGPGERMFVEAHERGGYTYHRFRSSGEGPGALAIARHEDAILFIRMFRPATGETLVELPRGQGDLADGGDPVRTARRELEEETGWTCARARLVGRVWPDSGLSGDHTSIVLCEELAPPAPTRVGEAEIGEVFWLTIPEIRACIAQGEIADGQTLSALLIAGVL